MRLIQTTTLELREFYSEIPEYVILSHTWQTQEEVSLQELEGRLNQSKAGWSKIKEFCEIASNKGFAWAWIDTCCIDKTSSAELSEAINSMFQWYQNAALCYAYLADVDERSRASGFLEASSNKPFWFTRGWTLQELIAPRNLIFFAADWTILGTKSTLSTKLSRVTGISNKVLLQPEVLLDTSIARRMSWASERKTTRPEDIAYCLMGIFDVNMPLLYGEGSSKAFIRLQEEIIKNSEDQSLFAWQPPTNILEDGHDHLSENEGLFAVHPIAFRNSFNFVPHRKHHAPYKTTNRGLEIEIPITGKAQKKQENGLPTTGILSCHDESNWGCSIGVALDQSFDKYYRKKGSTLVLLKHEEADSARSRIVHIHKWGKRPAQGESSRYCHIRSVPSGVQFSEGLIVDATTVSTSYRGRVTLRPGESVTQWSDHRKSVVLPTLSSKSANGYFLALDFRLDQALAANWGISGGLTVLVKLCPEDFQVLRICPWAQRECETHNFLSGVLEKYHDMTAFAKDNLVTRGGTLRISLEKLHRWGLETFVVDLDHQPFEFSTIGDVALNRVEFSQFV